MKLIVDWWNGGRWQWKYFDYDIGLWFDYGPPFTCYAAAQDWMTDERKAS